MDELTTPTTGIEPSPATSRTTARPLIGGLSAWMAVAIIAVDQLTKAIVRARIPLYEDVPIVPGLLSFTHVRNTGAAFGLLNAIEFPFKSALIAVLAAAALVAIAAYAARLAPAQNLARVGLAFILGGAVGNLIDRVTLGSVVDFVDFYWRSYHFWAFNVADAAITAGVAVMLFDVLGLGSHVSKTV